MNSFWMVLACGVACAYALPTCDQASFKKCEKMKPFNKDDDMFPSDPVKLQEQCSRARPALEYCAEVSLCPGFVSPITKEFFFAARDLTEKLCVGNGEFQQKYLKSAKCLNDVIPTKHSVCSGKASQEETLGLCQRFKVLERCLYATVRDTCGAQAEEVFEEVYNVIRKIMEEDVC